MKYVLIALVILVLLFIGFVWLILKGGTWESRNWD